MSSYHHGIQQVCSHGKGPFAHVAGATLMITCRVGRMRPSPLPPNPLPLSPQHPLLLPRSKRQCRVINRGGRCSGRRDGLHGQFEACAGGGAHGVSSPWSVSISFNFTYPSSSLSLSFSLSCFLAPSPWLPGRAGVTIRIGSLPDPDWKAGTPFPLLWLVLIWWWFWNLITCPITTTYYLNYLMIRGRRWHARTLPSSWRP